MAGYGVVIFSIVAPGDGGRADIDGGSFVEVHRIMYPGTSDETHVTHPNMFLEWHAENVDGATAHALQAASGAIFTEGSVVRRTPIGASVSNNITTTTADTEYISQVLFVPLVFPSTGTISQCEAHLFNLIVDNDGSRPVTIRLRRASLEDFTTTPSFTSSDSQSCIATWTPSSADSGVTIANTRLLASAGAARNNMETVDLMSLDVLIAAGDYILVTVSSNWNGGGDARTTITWIEDQ